MADVWTTVPVLDGEHIVLRPLDRADGPAIVAAAADGQLGDAGVEQIP